MKQLTTAILLALTAATAGSHELDTSLYPARIEGAHYGYIDAQSGFKSINDIYDTAYPFYDGRASVEMLSSWGFIDREGALAVPFRYKAATSFYFGHAYVVKPGGDVDIIDTAGQRTGTLGRGTMIVTPHRHVIRTALDGHTSLLDLDGNLLADSLDDGGNFRIIDDNGGGILTFLDLNTRRCGFMNLQGSIVLPARFRAILDSDNGLVVACDDSHTGLIDITGAEILPFIYNDITNLGNGLYSCEPDDASGCHIFDARARRWLYEGSDLRILRPSGSAERIPAFDGKQWGYVDSCGKWQIEPSYITASAFHDGIAAVAIDYLDTPGDYASILIDSDGRAAGGHPRFNRYIYPFEEQAAAAVITDDACDPTQVADAILAQITPTRVGAIAWDATVAQLAQRDLINHDTFTSKYVFVNGTTLGSLVNFDLVVDGAFTDAAGRVNPDARCSSITVVAQLFGRAEEQHRAIAQALLRRLGIESNGGNEQFAVTIAGRNCTYEKVDSDITLTFKQ